MEEGFVLIGGGSTRMGRPKWELPWRGGRVVDQVVSAMRLAGLRVHIVGTGSPLPGLSKVPVLEDVVPGLGPLGGLQTALLAAESEAVCMAACDMPYLEPALFRQLRSVPGEFDVVVPEDSRRGIHPLAARYSRRCLPVIARMTASGRRAVRDLSSEAGGLRVCRLPVGPLGITDSCFENLNTPDEYRRAIRNLKLPPGGSESPPTRPPGTYPGREARVPSGH